MPNTLNTRIYLRSDVLSAWTSANPVLGKGELAVVFDPQVTGERAIRIKIGDGVSTFSELPYVADYDEQLSALRTALAGKQDALTVNPEVGESTPQLSSLTINGTVYKVASGTAAINWGSISGDIANQADLAAALDAKVDGTATGTNGTSQIFNESDGGGVMFTGSEHKGFVGVHDGSNPDQTFATLYVKTAAGATEVRIDLDADGKAHYLKGSATAADGNEIATVGDISSAVSGKADASALTAEVARAEAAEQELSDRIDAVVGFDYEVVQTLPTPSEEVYAEKKLYLLAQTAVGSDAYDEYICVRTGTEGDYSYAMEKIGSTRIDLSNYYTKSETDALLANKTDYAVNGANGRALIFNETDGGGAKFEHSDGTWSGIAVNDGGANGLAAQLYAVNSANTSEGTKINIEKSKITYIKNKATSARTDDDEIAVVGQVNAVAATAAAKQDPISEGTGIDITDNVVSLDLSEIILNCGGAE